jgi:hypothetical protein
LLDSYHEKRAKLQGVDKVKEKELVQRYTREAPEIDKNSFCEMNKWQNLKLKPEQSLRYKQKDEMKNNQFIEEAMLW